MGIDALIEALKEDLIWCEANEWETPITMGDHIEQAIELLERMVKR